MQARKANAPDRLKIHAAGNIQQDHRVVGRHFRPIVRLEAGRHDLLGVAHSSVLDVALVIVAEVLGRRLDCTQVSRTTSGGAVDLPALAIFARAISISEI
jgi:hypothetical protein